MSEISEINLPSGNYDIKDEKARSIVAPEFSSSTAYAVGDYVIYEGALYKCTTAHSAGAWSSGDFTQTQVVDEVGGGGGGHTIENSAGTALTQRDTLQFKGGLSASDDSTNEVTVVDDTVPEIEWSVWNAMTPQEQEAVPNAIIFNAPGGGGGSTEDIEAIVNVYGSKNLNSYPYGETTKTENGITFTDNGDGTITVSGTATDDASFVMHYRMPNTDYPNDCWIANGSYILSGCPDNGLNKYYIDVLRANDSNKRESYGRDYGSGRSFDVNGGYYSPDGVWIELVITIKSGVALTTPITFKPMIRDARISDGTYVPYAMTNRELTTELNSKISYTSYTTVETYGIQHAFDSDYSRVTVCGNICEYQFDITTTNEIPAYHAFIKGMPIPTMNQRCISTPHAMESSLSDVITFIGCSDSLPYRAKGDIASGMTIPAGARFQIFGTYIIA